MVTVLAPVASARQRIERGNIGKMVTVCAPVAFALHQAIRLRICIRPYIQIQGEEAVGVLERLPASGLLGHSPRCIVFLHTSTYVSSEAPSCIRRLQYQNVYTHPSAKYRPDCRWTAWRGPRWGQRGGGLGLGSFSSVPSLYQTTQSQKINLI
jgi:hypothetical protein